jgi:hypothetical protein
MLALREVNGVSFTVGHGPEILCKYKDLSYFSKMDRKIFAEKTIKIISDVIIMRYVQL